MNAGAREEPHLPADPPNLDRQSVCRSAADGGLVIAATFAADPIERPLKFWMRELGLPGEVDLAPYAQVLQELLNPQSSLSQNQQGIGVVLIRVEWLTKRPTR
jgi:hypothetical protein